MLAFYWRLSIRFSCWNSFAKWNFCIRAPNWSDLQIMIIICSQLYKLDPKKVLKAWKIHKQYQLMWFHKKILFSLNETSNCTFHQFLNDLRFVSYFQWEPFRMNGDGWFFSFTGMITVFYYQTNVKRFEKIREIVGLF